MPKVRINKASVKLSIYIMLFVLFILSINTGSASISYSSSYDKIFIKDEASVNLTDIYNTLSPTYGDSFISKKDNGVWYLNKTILLDRSTFYIAYPEVSELRLCGSTGVHLHGTSTGSNGNGFVIDNVSVIGWLKEFDIPDNTTLKKKIEIDKGHISNSTFSNISTLKLYNVYDTEIDNITLTNNSGWLEIRDGKNSIVHDIHIYNSKGALNTFYLTNFEFYNISVHNIEFSSVSFTNTNYSLFHNISVEHLGSYLNPGSSGGLYWKDSSHNTGYHFYINDTGWSSFAPGNNYGNWSDIEIWNSGHNGIDLHSIKNTVINNVKVYDSVSNNILLTAGYATSPSTENITITNVYSRNSGIVAQDNVSDIYISDVYQEGDRDGIGLSAKNFTLINATFASNDKYSTVNMYKLSGIDCIDVSIIDSSFYQLNAISGIYNRIINCNYSTQYYKNKAEYYYIDIVIKDEMGNPVKSRILFQNEVNSSYPSVNGFGKNRVEYYTNAVGRLSFPNQNRSESPALAKDNRDTTGTYQLFSHTADITTPEGRTVSLSGIAPDSSWYRPDPNVPTYTITAIIPDTSSKGPHITGFAPSTDNPFNPGEKKNFRVWTDEPLTEMEWYVDGSDSPVSKGSLNYAWPVTEGNHIIKFTGSNANGIVNQVWNLGESPDEPPAQDIYFAPVSAVLTRNVSESVVFSVSPDIFTTKEWYVNGERVLSNMASMSRSWDKAGTYNVTFSGSGSGESVLHTWTVDVIGDTSEPQNVSITSITPEYQVVTPGKQFDLNIKVDPETAITGAQLNFVFNSSMVSANVAKEGDLFKQNGAQTLFSGGTIDKSTGKIKNIYGFIIGTSTVSSPGTMATVNLTAGNSTGIAEFSLSNVLISDANSKSTPYTVTSSTVLIDTAPVMNPICCPKSVDEKSTLTFKVGAKDADGNSLTYSASGLPAGAGFNTTSGLFTWTPAVGQAGVYTFTFEVSDGYLTDSKNVTVTVNRLNNLPVINYFEPLNGAFFSEGEKINISVNASDADGQALKYSLMIDGVECSTDPAYVWDTDYSSSGNHTISLAVSDGIDEVKEQHSIYINNYHPRWDVNEDGIVNILDITIIAQNYGTDTKKPYPRWDVNQDGVVNIQDLTLAGYYFGEIVI